MKAHKIADSIVCVYANIECADLFEGIWPIPRGVSLNCYLVQGKKTALIDLIRDWSEAPRQLEEALASAGTGFDKIDYLILNHLEPDHTGWLREFRRINPRAEIISTAKGINLVKTFYKEEEGLRVVADGEKLDLGGLELVFFETPNIHWPETMMTWEPQSGTLFSCDAFGSFGALGDRVFDDEFSPKEHAFYEAEGLRYYASIVSSFSTFVERGINKISSLDLACVAPSHGIVWRKHPQTILDRYRTYIEYSRGAAEKEITVIWGSMYGNTWLGAEAVIRGIEAEGVPCHIHRIPNEDVSYSLADAFKSSALVLAMPTYEYAMFPPMAYVLDIFRRKHIFGKTVFRIGSWGWTGGAKKEYEAAIEALRWESVPSMEWAGAPTEQELVVLEGRGRELARMVKT
ncbi:MAG: FprA family A-type flavoprotein [Spirochaetaceae bacterium]|jgi:flavorubredoxin|nr:FprA family A-type flavoprotein [Spirochaetaceae bacterium]